MHLYVYDGMILIRVCLQFILSVFIISYVGDVARDNAYWVICLRSKICFFHLFMLAQFVFPSFLIEPESNRSVNSRLPNRV